MIIVLKKDTQKKQIDYIMKKISELGLKPLYLPGTEKTVIGAIGDERVLRSLNLESLPSVEKVVPILKPYKAVSREFKAEDTVIEVEGEKIGSKDFTMVVGPCAIESKQQLLEIALKLKKLGVKFLRGGAYKPRTSPYSFTGLEEKGLKILKEVKEKTGLITVTELMDTRDFKLVSEHTDIIQIGSRNMQNFKLLKEVGQSKKPVILKRGFAATIEEFLLAAEYIVSEGNPNVILCERGIRTFETATRNTFDINAIPLLKELTHLPIIGDPSHGCGKRSLIIPLTKAIVAAGADGAIIEAHTSPEKALSDGDQQLNIEEFSKLMNEVQPLIELTR
ncbi:3-deoxy-7-phosphoheptulonate synthase [Candidatus Woesearchaeota archaeon]|nr:3-deoxy-7-phosphoheptulonate synthase [Candidatus Woesearchaeota archaeon]